MSETEFITQEQHQELDAIFAELLKAASVSLEEDNDDDVREAYAIALNNKQLNRFSNDKPSIYKTLDVARIVVSEIGLGRSSLICTLLYEAVYNKSIAPETVEKRFSPQVSDIIKGLIKAAELYERSAAIETENFRKLLLTFARDIRVILIMVADRLYTIRNLDRFEPDDQMKVARETSYLYAPLAHRLGLYRIKSEFEDLSLKYTNRTLYKDIAKRLNETKRSRDAYIDSFIKPIKERLESEGFKFEIKGRTKTIFSILNKLKKGIEFDELFDLFAIRIILDTPIKNEKPDCWKVYSIITDIFPPNPKRLRDWLSIPKSNGYETLHTTVM